MNRFFKSFRRADGGMSAIEFALILPIMLATFFGIAEISNYILAARKVANVASAAADLVAQDTVIDDTEISDIMGALDVVLRPFNPADAQVRITSVVADSDGETTVAWSDARNTSAYSEGSPITVPDDIVPDNQGIIMAEVSFTYKTLFGMYLTDGMTVSDTFYLKPRRSTQVLRQ
ncbi:MAG: pilus assembly protein [Alphaproteobacteria bacterium]|nr:pilus assembly protein [Alphaproteobacteria bacterium]